MRRQSPTSATQSVATIAANSGSVVSWQIRSNNTAAAAAVTMTLCDASGATVKTVRQSITVTN